MMVSTDTIESAQRAGRLRVLNDEQQEINREQSLALEARRLALEARRLALEARELDVAEARVDAPPDGLGLLARCATNAMTHDFCDTDAHKNASRTGSNPTFVRSKVGKRAKKKPAFVQSKFGKRAKKKPAFGRSDVGRRVKVWWDGERRSFSGVIVQTHEKKGAKVRYDDNDTQWEKEVTFLRKYKRADCLEKDRVAVGKRIRPATMKLGVDDGWGSDVARSWSSSGV